MKTRLLLSVVCMTAAISLSAQSFTGILKEAKELKDGGSFLEAAKKYGEARTGDIKGKELLNVLFPEALRRRSRPDFGPHKRRQQGQRKNIRSNRRAGRRGVPLQISPHDSPGRRTRELLRPSCLCRPRFRAAPGHLPPHRPVL